MRFDYLCRVVVVVLLLVLGASAPSAVRASIVNGSFESPVSPTGWYINYPGGTDLGGWKVVGDDAAIVNGTFTDYGITFQAQSGNQWIDLAGVTSNSTDSGVSQDFATIAGQEYQISFYVGSATDNVFFFPTTVDLSINGGARVSYTNPTAPNNMLNWKLFTALFTAAGTTSNITFYNGGASNNYNTALDNVSVDILSAAGVPEASSLVVWSLITVVVGGFSFCRGPAN